MFYLFRQNRFKVGSNVRDSDGLVRVVVGQEIGVGAKGDTERAC